MALKDTWIDLVNGESEVVVEPINDIAKATIDLEESFGKQYELLEEITLEEAVASFRREMDTNGVPYNLSAIRVKVNTPAASSAQLILALGEAGGSSLIYHQTDNGIGTAARVTQLVACNDCGLMDYYVVNSAVNGFATRSMKEPYVVCEWKNVVSLTIRTYPTSVLIPAGTTITIYGIKESTNES